MRRGGNLPRIVSVEPGSVAGGGGIYFILLNNFLNKFKNRLTELHWEDEIVAKVLEELVYRDLLQETYFAGHQRRHCYRESV